jgi:hypothetical protein
MDQGQGLPDKPNYLVYIAGTEKDVHTQQCPNLQTRVFVKTSPKRSYSVIENERFGLVFVKTVSVISGTGQTRIGIRRTGQAWLVGRTKPGERGAGNRTRDDVRQLSNICMANHLKGV